MRVSNDATWAPPNRWRMDVSSPHGTFALISTPDSSYSCPGDEGGMSGCVAISANEAETGAPFGLIFTNPTQILDEIRVNVAAAVDPDAH